MGLYYDRNMHIQERLYTLAVVSGYSLDELIDLFAKGYTLQPPREPGTLSELCEEKEKENE